MSSNLADLPLDLPPDLPLTHLGQDEFTEIYPNTSGQDEFKFGHIYP